MKSKWILIVLNFICLNLLSAQTESQKEDLKQSTTKIDSLLAIYNHPDSTALSKVNALSSLFNQYLYNDQNTAKKYLAQIKEISDRHALQKGKTRYNYFKGILFDLSGQLDSALIYYNRAYVGYKDLKDNLQISRNLLNIANINFQNGRYQQAIDTLQSAISIETYTANKDTTNLLYRIY